MVYGNSVRITTVEVDGQMITRLQYRDFVWEWGKRDYPTRASKRSEMMRIAGGWPPDSALVTLADGDDPGMPSHFGGHVESIGPDRKRVTVYID